MKVKFRADFCMTLETLWVHNITRLFQFPLEHNCIFCHHRRLHYNIFAHQVAETAYFIVTPSPVLAHYLSRERARTGLCNIILCFYRTRVPVVHAQETLRAFQTLNHSITFSACVLQASPEKLVLSVSSERN